MGFFTKLAEAHGKKAIRQVTEAAVALDPETASAAQLAAMEEALKNTAAKLAQYRIDAARERREADDAKARRDRMQAAGEKMYADFQAEPDAAKKAALQSSLSGLAAQVQKLNDELAREEQEANDAEALVAEAEQIVQEKGTAIMQAKTDLQNAMRDRTRAMLSKQQAEERQDHAAELAGLRNNEVGGLNTALQILHKQTDDARAAADAAKITTEQITVVDPGTSRDPNVLAALAAVDDKAHPDDVAALFGPKSAEPLKISQQ